MIRVLQFVGASIAATLLLTAVVTTARLEGWFHQPGYLNETPTEFLMENCDPTSERFGGNFIVLQMENGQAVASLATGPDQAIPTPTSVFQIASLSKWITAAGVLVLVENGLIDLDEPVETYLTRWSFPPSEFDAGRVTVRHLLAHTSGLTDGLGYNGFEDARDVQNPEASLTRALDAMSGITGRVALGMPPGAHWQYSGGGYTLLQLLVEEVTGQDFADAMQDLVFQPLDMKDSTFDHADVAGTLAPNFDQSGAPAEPRFYSALAAASLYTTAQDLARFLAAFHSDTGGTQLLTQDTIAEMARAQATRLGLPVWGLGVTLYVWHNDMAEVVGHDGRNQPAINTTARLHMSSGDAIIALSSGATDLATRCGDAWVRWRTGRMAITELARSFVTTALIIFLSVAVLAGSAFFASAKRNADGRGD